MISSVTPVQHAGSLAKLDMKGWGSEPLGVEVSTFDVFQLPSPTEGLPSTGWLPAAKLPALAPQQHRIHPIPEGITRLPLSAANHALQSSESSSLKSQNIQARPKVSRAEVGCALAAILAEQNCAKEVTTAVKAPLQAVSQNPVAVGAVAPSAPAFAKRTNGLLGATKPVAQSKPGNNKQAAGTSSKRPPLPAKRPLPASGAPDAKPTAPKRPKPPKQKPVTASAGPVVGRNGITTAAQQTSASQPPLADPAAENTQASGPGPNDESMVDKSTMPAAIVESVPPRDKQGEPPAARKRTQISDVDPAAVEIKVADCKARGKLGSLTVPELKTWLKAHKLPVGGKKADLVARLQGGI